MPSYAEHFFSLLSSDNEIKNVTFKLKLINNESNKIFNDKETDNTKLNCCSILCLFVSAISTSLVFTSLFMYLQFNSHFDLKHSWEMELLLRSADHQCHAKAIHNKDERFWQLPHNPKVLLAFGPHCKYNIFFADTEY